MAEPDYGECFIKGIIVFTDLDGTLLDHDTYRYDEAREGLDLLSRHEIPLILVSSKTKCEIEELHRELSLRTPFVFENGGGIATPEEDTYAFTLLGRLMPEEIKDALVLLSEENHAVIRTLAELTAEEVSALTALTLPRAILAKKRLASAPFIADRDIDCDRANRLLLSRGLRVIRGARFYHLQPASVDKGKAVAMIKRDYEEAHGTGYRSAGIGDGYNDIPLLQSVDMPFLVRKKDGNFIECGINGIHVVGEAGPAGFTMAVKEIIDSMGGRDGHC